METWLRGPLRDTAFELDGEQTRRFVQFSNCVFDRITLTFGENTPDFRVTTTTEWAWEGSGLSHAVEPELVTVLEQVGREAQAEAGLSEETCARQEALHAGLGGVLELGDGAEPRRRHPPQVGLEGHDPLARLL